MKSLSSHLCAALLALAVVAVGPNPGARADPALFDKVVAECRKHIRKSFQSVAQMSAETERLKILAPHRSADITYRQEISKRLINLEAERYSLMMSMALEIMDKALKGDKRFTTIQVVGVFGCTPPK